MPDCTCDSLNEYCPEAEDNIHCKHWWDGIGACCFCGVATCPAVNTETGEHP